MGGVYARKCVEFLATREHGTKLLNIYHQSLGVLGMNENRLIKVYCNK